MTEQAPETPPVPPVAPVEGIRVPDPPKSPLLDEAFMSSAFKEYGEKGDLSAETYAKFESAGVPKSLISDYVASKTAAVQYQEYQRQAATEKVLTECGGKDNVEAALAWAQKNLPQQDIDAINRQLQDTNPQVVITAVKGLQSRAGVGASMVPGKSGAVGAAVPYENESQWMADIRNPLYDKDPAFRASVDVRLDAAIRAGKIRTNNIYAK